MATDLNTTNLGKKPGWLLPSVLTSAILVGLPLLCSMALSGKSAAEKVLTVMIQPLFVSILVVTSVAVVLWRRGERALAILLWSGVLALWTLSTSMISNVFVNGWEELVDGEPDLSQPLDYIVVLGGGTGATPDGRAQFGEAGDRVGYAARLFLTGKTKRLVTTGDVINVSGTLSGKFDELDDPSHQTRRIWTDLGIPKDAIFELAGENTSAEIASLKEHPEWWRESRCGLLTSALHLPRALKLAERAGVKVIPIGADYRSGRGPITVISLMPNASSLSRLQSVFKEWVAMRVSR